MAWVQHMIKSINSNGRMAVVLPNGVLFRKGSEETIRKYLLEKDLIETIIMLGSNIFYGTPISPCILIFKKKKDPTKKGKIFFIDASDQMRVGRAQNYLDPEHIKKIFEWYNNYKNINTYTITVPLENIKKNEYSLHVPLYVKKFLEKNFQSKEEVLSKLKKIWVDYLKSEKKFLSLINKFTI